MRDARVSLTNIDVVSRLDKCCWMSPFSMGREVAGRWCDTPAQGLIGLIGYLYQQVATSFPEAGLQRTPRLSVLGLE